MHCSPTPCPKPAPDPSTVRRTVDGAWVLALLVTAGCGRPASDPNDPGDYQVAAPDVADLVPLEATPAQALSTEALEHTELLRIGRNFGKQEFEIALDAWVDRERPRELALVRLWWARGDRDLERSPFGSRTRRHFEIDDSRIAPDHWRVNLIADRKVFSFEIQMDENGKPAAYAAVRLPGGETIDRCRVDRGELQARRVLGVPAGIDDLAVACTAPDGVPRQGHIAWTPEQRR